MTDIKLRIQIIYAGILALILLYVFFTLSLGWKILGSIVILLVIGYALWRIIRYQKILRSSVENFKFLSEKLALMPASQRYRMPILLVTGSAAQNYFSENAHISDPNIVVSSEAIWLYVPEVKDLSIAYDSLVSKWPDMVGRIGVYFAVNPEIESKKNIFDAKMDSFRQSWANMSRIAKYKIPVYVAVHINLNHFFYKDESLLPKWFILEKEGIFVADEYFTYLDDWVNAHSLSIKVREGRLHLQAFLQEAQAWTEKLITRRFSDSKLEMGHFDPEVIALYPIENQVIADNILSKHWVDNTGLDFPHIAYEGENINVPDEIVKYMPISRPFTPWQSLLFSLIILSFLFLSIGLVSSYYNNKTFYQKISKDIVYYKNISNDRYDQKLDALNLLRTDRHLLEQYALEGEPVKLSLGLYRGGDFIVDINHAIASYVSKPPEPKEIIVTKTEVKTPKVINLQSIALFETGQSSLKPGSTKLLIGVLVELQDYIKSNPGSGWLFLISGHTDNVGDEQTNQQLSFERAKSVRDWLVSSSDIPQTCFAIQGYGATQPLADNETPQGRAQNRRVEISLVPHENVLCH